MSGRHALRLNIDRLMAESWHMTTEEVGAYMLIICRYWQTERPLSEQEVFDATKLTDESWGVSRSTLAERFSVSDCGEWSNSWIDKEIGKVSRKLSNIRAARNNRPISKLPNKGRHSGKAWKDLRLAVFERDGYRCRYCNIKCEAPHCDHYMPVCRGGSNDMENLVTACPSCNLKKNDKHPDDWRALQ